MYSSLGPGMVSDSPFRMAVLRLPSQTLQVKDFISLTIYNSYTARVKALEIWL